VRLPSPQVVASGFARPCRVPKDTQQVVSKLEGLTQILSVGRERVTVQRADIGRCGPDEQGVFDGCTWRFCTESPCAGAERLADLWSTRPSHGRTREDVEELRRPSACVRIRSKIGRARSELRPEAAPSVAKELVAARSGHRSPPRMAPGNAQDGRRCRPKPAAACSLGKTPVCRRHPPSGVAVVHDVVMMQGRSLRKNSIAVAARMTASVSGPPPAR